MTKSHQHGSLNWIVVPGGPGLSKDYLEFGLNLNGWPLVFYEPIGSPMRAGKDDLQLSNLITQIDEVACEQGLAEYGLIAHSFGSYLAIEAMQLTDKVKALILINPMPFDFDAWQTALLSLQEQLPDSLFEQLTNQSLDGDAIFKLLLPYYTKQTVDWPPSAHFDNLACEALADQVPDFQHQSIMQETSVPWVGLWGEHDPFYQDTHQEQRIVVPHVAHYPFFEDPNAFYDAMQQALAWIEQKRNPS